ncbi:MAG: relaxase/mobilization nuclease domain-containing protein [bacterium]|nr:relaxase/mobilization nuclease domain-containing protein [bacterium]
MAYVNANTVHFTLNKALDYYADKKNDFAKITGNSEFYDVLEAGNNEKVQYIYCDHCSYETAEEEWTITRKKAPYDKEGCKDNILCYHIWQSFAPGEVTAEQAHQIGKEFAERCFGGKYSYIVTTHLDTHCLHNHIAFCSVDYVNHKKFPTKLKTAKREWRNISDEICLAHGLSIINNKSKSKSKSQTNSKIKKGQTWRDVLRNDIDKIIQTSDSFEEFLEEMCKLGYAVKADGKFISFRHKEMKRFMRLSQKTLGEDYTEDAIRERIITKRPSIPKHMRNGKKKITLIIDIDANIKCQTSDAYKNWATIHNIQEASKALNFLIDNGVGTYDEMDKKVDSLQNEKRQSTKSLQQIDKEIYDLKDKLKLLNDFNDVKKYIIEYNNLSGKEKRQYKEKHYNEFQRFEILKRRIDAEYPNSKIPSAKKMQRELDELIKRREELYEKHKIIEKDIEDFSTARNTINTFMHRHKEPQHGEQQHSRTEQASKDNQTL